MYIILRFKIFFFKVVILRCFYFLGYIPRRLRFFLHTNPRICSIVLGTTRVASMYMPDIQFVCLFSSLKASTLSKFSTWFFSFTNQSVVCSTRLTGEGLRNISSQTSSLWFCVSCFYITIVIHLSYPNFIKKNFTLAYNFRDWKSQSDRLVGLTASETV